MELLYPILYTAFAVAGVFFLFSLLAAIRIYLEKKTGKDVSYDWDNILDFSSKAVNAVRQIHSVRPPNLTDQQWNDLRYSEAENMVVSYAKSLGIDINKESLTAIRGSIEAAVLELKAKRGKSVPVTNPLSYGGRVVVEEIPAFDTVSSTTTTHFQ